MIVLLPCVTLTVDSQLFPAYSTGLASTGEAYPFIQDFKEEENIILFHSKVGFSFRKMAEWNENVSI